MRDEDYDEYLIDHPKKSGRAGCQCVGDDFPSGGCPGPDACPLCDEGEEDEEEDEEEEVSDEE